MKQPVISIENLSKSYSVYSRPTDLLFELALGKSRHDTFWALRDINLTITEGQRVGIIGPNGAGKSTLLKVITGNLSPTSGKIDINGKISAMLSLATSLNPEESGLSNIAFNLLLQGASRFDINRLTEEIVDFTELGDFIYRPVKTYSSGMNARLAFAIATAIEPEILIVDEILGAGDGYFVGKATKRMIDLCNKGKALLFVSHSTSAVQMLCDSVVWMENGSIRMTGTSEYVLKMYEEDYRRREDETTREMNIQQSQNRSVIGTLENISEENIYRFRIVPDNSQRSFSDIHYLRKVRFGSDALDEIDISLELSETSENDIVRLDLLHSEWGRVYTKNDSVCRILTKRTGKDVGGQILYKTSTAENDEEIEVSIYFETISIGGRERLTVEFFNYLTGNWELCSYMNSNTLDDGWTSSQVKMKLPILSEASFKASFDEITEKLKPDVEILEIITLVQDASTYIVDERIPFKVNVKIKVNRLVSVIDVGIKIMRSDGVYVFWQSSGMTTGNLINVSGEVMVSFSFDPNCFGEGEYYVSAHCSNGWDLEKNYPYSQVYARSVNACKFLVKREFPDLGFGQINVRAPVSYNGDNFQIEEMKNEN